MKVPIKRVGAFTRARRTHALRTIVVLATDDGLVGLGETRGIDAARIIRGKFAPLILGQPDDDIARLRDRCIPAVADYGYPEQLVERSAFAAVDMALWDILGKRTGLPLFKLLGGAVRRRAEFVAYEYTVDPEEGRAEQDVPALMAEKAAAAIAETGSRYFEFKIGVHSIDCDIATTAAIRSRLGDAVQIGVDANMALDYEAARRFLSATADFGLSNVEEPVASLAQMDRLARDFGAQISSHCIDLDALRSYPGITGVVGDPHAAGGILPMDALIERVRAANRRFWFRSVWELGIAWAAMCHMAVAFSGLERPSQSLFNLIEDDLIEEQSWALRDGAVTPPDVPGLGVTLDRRALDFYKLA